MEKRFRILRIIGTIYKVIGWIILILGILLALASCALGALGGAAGGIATGRENILPGLAGGGVVAGIGGAVIILFLALLYFLAIYAFGEAIYLALAVEENTRETVMLLRDLRLGPAAAPAPPEAPPPA